MSASSIKGENILLLGPKFYGYCRFIEQELLKLGANVIYEQTQLWGGGRYSNKGWLRKNICRIKNHNWERKETKKILKSVGNTKIDKLIVIAVYSSSISLIDELRRNNPRIETYIYFWDAFSTWNFSYILDLFDYCYSFDRQDCEKYKKLKYLPLFWRPEQITSCIHNKYDIVFIGTLLYEYSKRLDICPKIYLNGLKENLNNFIYLVWSNKSQNKIIYRTKQFIKGILRDPLYCFAKKVEKIQNLTPIIHETPLPIALVTEIESSSRAILDINMNRSGLAMRIIGAIANGKKIITNNRFIVEEEFYKAENIWILDENNPIVNKDWLYSPNAEININYLRIDNWIKTILHITN